MNSCLYVYQEGDLQGSEVDGLASSSLFADGVDVRSCESVCETG